MTFSPIKTSHCYIGTIPNKLTHNKRNVYNFFSFGYYLLYELLVAMEQK